MRSFTLIRKKTKERNGIMLSIAGADPGQCPHAIEVFNDKILMSHAMFIFISKNKTKKM